jgi:YebC/PmpR family DNA-binding regulatory protein
MASSSDGMLHSDDSWKFLVHKTGIHNRRPGASLAQGDYCVAAYNVGFTPLASNARSGRLRAPPAQVRTMGRIFEVRKHAMFARWNRMAKQFARIGKEITIAVKKGGPDPDSNPALRRCIQNARAVNMPKDKIEAAIKRASGRDAANFEEVLYEGYAPHGVAVLVECATDNPTRTVASVRNAFSKNGGNLATTGSVAFQFKRMGVFRLNPEGIDQDDLELYLIDHGLEEFGESTGEKGEPQLVARCLFEDFGTLQKALEDRGITPISAEQEYICQVPTELPEAQATEVLELIDKLEQDEDVQKVYHTLA